MKALSALAFILLISFATASFAQSPKAIEAGLVATLKKIDEFRRPGLDDQDTATNYNTDMLSKANSAFVNRLKYYHNNSPSALTQTIRKIGGAVSNDGLFWIYSWDTGMGGTEHIFQNAIRYRSVGKYVLLTDALNDGKNYVYAYDKVYTLEMEGKKFYLATYYGIFDLHERGEGIRVFAIENGKLNTKVNLIHTKSGFTGKLYYTYDQHDNNLDTMGDPTIEYDPKTKTITFPVINSDGQITDNNITYKFTGKYFEKVK